MPQIDARGWVAIGLFALVAFLLLLISFNPALAAVKPVEWTLNTLTTGGVLLVASYYFGDKKKDPTP